ncbi:pyrroloquinoline quinone biosynthesis peptide chaperone PqqD [Muricoccus radiodurans]|uniref:pyrroloquinoline quinone biosynthesis peptide chaperone PqqD n=1 Tax=Muricoccus radiodurans TaxID=2231721 RepID=UPI003CF8885D
MTVGPDSVLRFARGMRLREDPARGRWVVVGPERLFVPDETALEILRLLDGARSVDAVVDALAARYDAPREAIATDVIAMLDDLAAKGVVAPS